MELPDDLPALPEGGASCNETHCLVNRADLVTIGLAMQMVADRLASKDAQIAELARRLELEQARGPHCAKVERIDPPSARKTGGMQ